MRIIGGRMRGLGLAPVGKGDAAGHLRPTSDRVRESIFNLLMGGRFGDPVDGARVLDLFAGTGALGLEALSRGADAVCFVETGRAGARLLVANIARAAATEACTVLRRDATRLGMCPSAPFDLVFLDPPYGKALGAAALTSAAAGGWLCDGATIVWEERQAMDAPAGFSLLHTRRYGDTVVSLLNYGR